MFQARFETSMLLGYIFNADAALAITAELKEVLQHAFTRGEFEMAAVVDLATAESESGFEVEVE